MLRSLHKACTSETPEEFEKVMRYLQTGRGEQGSAESSGEDTRLRSLRGVDQRRLLQGPLMPVSAQVRYTPAHLRKVNAGSKGTEVPLHFESCGSHV